MYHIEKSISAKFLQFADDSIYIKRKVGIAGCTFLAESCQCFEGFRVNDVVCVFQCVYYSTKELSTTTWFCEEY